MKKFVELIQRVHKERFSVVMNKIAAEQIPIAFLSLEPVADAIQIVNNLRENGANVTTLITLYNSVSQKLKINFNIVHIDKVSTMHPRPEYIFVTSFLEARVAIKNLPYCKTLNIDKGNTDHIYQTFMNHLLDLQEVYESLIDDNSKRTFYGYWLSRISNQMSEIVYSNSAHYLIAGFIPKQGAITFDAGVFDGGTATVFSEMGYKVYGFEMDRKNFEKVKSIAEEKNFVIENLSLGSYKHTMRYDAYGNSGSKWNNKGSEITQVTTIDAYVREHNLPSVDFIKLDTEGSELEILKGAKTSIARYKPILAISAYHKFDDFWVLMNFIKSIRPDYEFAMRHGAETPEEEPRNISQEYADSLYALGLEPQIRYFGECVLFAR
ncbi:MAG: FkbM family methyltransferase [Selenomonadaceae bacterium]|nr:FkbM family methyltransferase [Selenomonadaceae bacterium]